MKREKEEEEGKVRGVMRSAAVGGGAVTKLPKRVEAPGSLAGAKALTSRTESPSSKKKVNDSAASTLLSPRPCPSRDDSRHAPSPPS